MTIKKACELRCPIKKRKNIIKGKVPPPSPEFKVVEDPNIRTSKGHGAYVYRQTESLSSMYRRQRGGARGG